MEDDKFGETDWSYYQDHKWKITKLTNLGFILDLELENMKKKPLKFFMRKVISWGNEGNGTN
jgi:hypothetical protein